MKYAEAEYLVDEIIGATKNGKMVWGRTDNDYYVFSSIFGDYLYKVSFHGNVVKGSEKGELIYQPGLNLSVLKKASHSYDGTPFELFIIEKDMISEEKEILLKQAIYNSYLGELKSDVIEKVIQNIHYEVARDYAND